MKSLSLPINLNDWLKAVRKIVPFLLVALVICLLTSFLPEAHDLERVFLPAARTALAGGSPYDDLPFYNPPWALFPIMPLLWLPIESVRALWFSLGALAFIAVMHYYGAKSWLIALTMLSPPVLYSLLLGNNDWLSLLGLLLPPRWGLLLLIIKPQLGIGVIVLWIARAYREDGWRGIWRLVEPTAWALMLSFALYGPWPLSWADLLQSPLNLSIGPFFRGLGVALLYISICKDSESRALFATPLLSPYLWGATLALPMIGSAKYPFVVIVCNLALWLIVLLT